MLIKVLKLLSYYAYNSLGLLTNILELFKYFINYSSEF